MRDYLLDDDSFIIASVLKSNDPEGEEWRKLELALDKSMIEQRDERRVN